MKRPPKIQPHVPDELRGLFALVIDRMVRDIMAEQRHDVHANTVADDHAPPAQAAEQPR